MSSRSETRQRLALTWDHYEQQFLSEKLTCNQEDSVEKRCWARGSGKGGNRAGVDATGRGGTARDGLPSKGPAMALVGGTSGRQPPSGPRERPAACVCGGWSLGSAAQHWPLQPLRLQGRRSARPGPGSHLPPAAGHAVPRQG